MSQKERIYMCIDMKSFYASVECAERNLNPFETNLVVADTTRGKNALCLAITPKMKAQGIKNRCRLSDIPRNVRYEAAMPRMEAMHSDAASNTVDQQIIAIQEDVLTLHRQKQRLAITEEEYQMRLEAFGEQLKALEEQRKQDRTAENRYAAIRLWLDAFKEHAENGDLMNDDDGSIMKALVETIVVKEESMEIRFKCGVTIEKEYVI